MSLHPITTTVASVERLTDQSVRISFNQPDGAPFSYFSGQYLTLIADINGKEERRAYSLCSSPYNNELPAVGVKLVEGGAMSPYLLSAIKAGDTFKLLAPLGHFALEPTPLNTRHIVLIGAGSGVTPLYSMLKTTLLAEPNSIVTLIYGNRDEDSIMFKAELDEWVNKFPARLRVVHCLSKAHDTWTGVRGRISGELLAELLEQMEPVIKVQETEYFLCGPAAMMDATTEHLRNSGVKPYQIHKESFFVQKDEAALEAVHQEQGIVARQVTIHFEGDTYEVMVQPDETILSAALEQDIPLPYSCQAGLCTACRAKCTSGEVFMDEMEGLSQSEVDEGYVLCCVAHPLSRDVVVNYD